MSFYLPQHVNQIASYLLHLAIKLQKRIRRVNGYSQHERTAIIARVCPNGNVLVARQSSHKHHIRSQKRCEPRRRAPRHLLQRQLGLTRQLIRLECLDNPLDLLGLLVIGVVSCQGRHCQILQPLGPSLQLLLQRRRFHHVDLLDALSCLAVSIKPRRRRRESRRGEGKNCRCRGAGHRLPLGEHCICLTILAISRVRGFPIGHLSASRHLMSLSQPQLIWCLSFL